MDPLTVLTALSAALKLAESLFPTVQAMAQRGEVTKEQQAALLARYESLRQRAAGQFNGPEWKVDINHAPADVSNPTHPAKY